MSAATAGATSQLGQFLGQHGVPSLRQDFQVTDWAGFASRSAYSWAMDSGVGHLADKWFGGATPDYGMVAVQSMANSYGNYLGTQIKTAQFKAEQEAARAFEAALGQKTAQSQMRDEVADAAVYTVKSPTAAERFFAGETDLPGILDLTPGFGYAKVQSGDSVEAMARRIDPANWAAVQMSMIRENGLGFDAKGNPVIHKDQVLTYADASTYSPELLAAEKRAGGAVTAYNTSRTKAVVAANLAAAGRSEALSDILALNRGDIMLADVLGGSPAERALAMGPAYVPAPVSLGEKLVKGAQMVVGAAEVLGSGMLDTGVDAAVSFSALAIGIGTLDAQAAIAVRERMLASSWHYTPDSAGAQAFGAMLQPAMSVLGDGLAATRQLSNQQIGLGVTAILFAAAEGTLALAGGPLLRSARGVGGVVPNSGKTVTLYRVDDANFAPRISPDGSVPVVTTRSGNERALFVNIGQPERAKEFALLNRGGNATITAVEVDAALLEKLRYTAVYDKSADAALLPNAPLRVDINKAPDQFGLRTPDHFQWLRDAIKPNTARTIDPNDL